MKPRNNDQLLLFQLSEVVRERIPEPKTTPKYPTRMIVLNVLGMAIRIFAGFHGDARYAWSIKYLTRECSICPHCIKHEAIAVIQAVDANKGRCQWSPPSPEKIWGICYWGIHPKILTPRTEGLRHCEYFDTPRRS